VKIFISYRRDDTAGRAGRLFDLLATRFGARNVFQDVTAIEPGTDFSQRVDQAIAQCDATLVVIGSDWLSMSGPDGTRRLDEPDDYVRREVGAALAAGVRVVPVLVDRAELPTPEDLPEALRPLAQRQAVALRDATWHQDVDALVRRLMGEELIETPRRRWPLVAGAAGVLAVAALAGWIWLGDDDNDGDDSTADEPTECPTTPTGWSPIEVRDGATGVQHMDTQSFAYTVLDAGYRTEESGETLVVLRAQLENRTTPVADTHDDDTAYTHTMFDRLLVDGLSVGNPYCFVVVVGDENQIEPGQRAVALVGYLTSEYVAGAELVVETDGDQEIEITPPG
jgi:TIR domain